jgi:hypothetical protein
MLLLSVIYFLCSMVSVTNFSRVTCMYTIKLVAIHANNLDKFVTLILKQREYGLRKKSYQDITLNRMWLNGYFFLKQMVNFL